jgi:hypothetical protein
MLVVRDCDDAMRGLISACYTALNSTTASIGRAAFTKWCDALGRMNVSEKSRNKNFRDFGTCRMEMQNNCILRQDAVVFDAASLVRHVQKMTQLYPEIRIACAHARTRKSQIIDTANKK